MQELPKSPTDKLDLETGPERAKVIAKPWKEKEDQVLKDNWVDHSAAEISKMLGRSRCSIIGRAARMGLPRKTNARKPRPVGIRPVLLKPVAPKKKRPKRKVWNNKRNPEKLEKPVRVLEPHPVLDGVGVHILEALPWHCREVIGKGPDLLARFCGKPKAVRPDWKGEMTMVAFCEEHAAKNYRYEDR